MRHVTTTLLVAALALAGCTSNGTDSGASPGAQGSIDAITVGVGQSLAPQLTLDRRVTYPKQQSKVLWEGDGEPLVDGQPLLLNLYSESLVDGRILANTFDGSPRPFLLAKEMLGEDLYRELLKVRIGARLLHVSPAPPDVPNDPPMVLVIDVLPVRATGTALEPRDDMPHVSLSASGEPVISIREGTEAPLDLQVATLIQGQGLQVQPGSQIVANYVGVVWDTGEVFSTSWPMEQAPLQQRVGEGRLPVGLDDALIDHYSGSQVLVVVPPDLGYADLGTVVFVVDILHVWTPAP